MASSILLLKITSVVAITLAFSCHSFALKEKNGGNAAKNSSSDFRNGKVFSLFNVVQFKNTGCRSTSSISGGGTTSTARNGTCYTASECQSKGGTAAGNCAAGFGVCCVFLVTASGATITQNCTYVRNPGYPSTYSGTSAVSYTVNKFCPNVCYLRLDFESFTILGTADTIQTNGGACASDTFIVTVTTRTPIPTICGQNTGQHMYIDTGAGNSDSATLSFAFASSSTSRQWEIKVTQVPCGSISAPPTGCLQYETGLTGRITTYNFIPTTQNHLANQQYSVCIRQEEGYCCIQYSVCSDPNSFALTGKGATVLDSSAVDTYCGTVDHVTIDSSRGYCSTSTTGNFVSNYCGQFLNVINKAKVSIPICDCTQPFVVGIFTDTTNNNMATLTPDGNRGLCLNWQQIPCSQA